MRAEDLTGLGDDELADAVRAGDVLAFGVLWERHAAAGRVAARHLTSTYDPDDVVQEAYLRILRSLQLGSGPTGPFRPYLYTTLRAVAATWSRTPAPIPVDELPDAADGTDLPTAVLERSMTVRAFRELPERWQSVLWYTEVEGMGAREAGPLLGLSASATAALAYRAREGLRRAWVQAHLSDGDVAPGCRWTVEHLGDHARGTLSPAARDRVEDHLAGCLSCAVLAEELRDVASRLRVLLVPFVLGVPATLGAVAAPAAPASASVGTSTASGSVTSGSVTSGSVTSGAVTSGSAVSASGASVSTVGVASAPASAVAGTASATAATALAGVAGAVAAVGTPGALVGLLVAAVVTAGVGVVALSQPWAAPDQVPVTPPAAVAVQDADGDRPEEAEDPVTSAPAPPVDAPPPGEPGGAGAATLPTADAEPPADVRPSGETGTAGPSVTPSSPSTWPAPVEPRPQPAPAYPELEPDPEPTTEPTPEPGPSEPEPEPGPEPSEPPEEPEIAPLLVTSAPRAGTLTVFPVVRGTGEPGALVRFTDGRRDVVASVTVGPDAAWEAALTSLEASGEHVLEVVQEVEGVSSALAATLGPYVFDLPSVLSPAAGAVVVGQLESWPWQAPRLATDVVLGGTPGLRVEAFVDGRSTGNLHTLGDTPLVRRVRDLAPGAHTFGLRVVDPGADGPGHGPTVTVPFTLAVP